MIKKTIFTIICVGLLFFGTTWFAIATPVVYTNEAAWLAAVSGATVQTENFESSPVGLLPLGIPFPGTDIGLFSIYHNCGSCGIEIRNSGAVNGTREFYGVVQSFATNSFTFDVPIIGFAGDWKGTADNLPDFDISILIMDDGVSRTPRSTFGGNLPSPGDGFLGIVDTIPFSRILIAQKTPGSGTFTPPLDNYSLDNVQIASGSAQVPEPTTILLLGSGLIGLVGYGRKKFFKK